MTNKKSEKSKRMDPQCSAKRQDGSVLLVSLAVVTILALLVGTTLLSTSNKYFTAYQWASWQEALQGAESAADLAMTAMRKDVNNQAAFGGWIATIGGQTKQLDSTGSYTDNSGQGNGNQQKITLQSLRSHAVDSLTYNTWLSPHAGEGNSNLRMSVTIDAPSTLVDSSQRQWLRVRASGSTDLTGPKRVSEERLDNRLRKLGLFWDNVLKQDLGSSARGVASRKIELVAKPVSMFSGALTAMVQIKGDDKGFTTDSYNSEDKVNWPEIPDPLNPSETIIDMTVSHDPNSPLGKNGDVASNAFPDKHDHSKKMDIKWGTIWGDLGNNYTETKVIDSAYYNNNGNPNNYGLNNGNFGTTNPNPQLIKTTNNASEGVDVSGSIMTNYYRDLPPITTPTWTSSDTYNSITYIDKKTGDLAKDKISTDPNNPTKIKVSGIKLDSKDKWTIKAPDAPKGSPAGTKGNGYVEIWVTGDIKLDDGGTIVIEDGVHAVIYFDHNIKVGEERETKTNKGGFDTQSDDAKDLLLLGITQPDAGKLPKDEYFDPLGNGGEYTPYKASGNVVFHENDFTGAIYAPDHNIVFESNDDGKGKRHKRKQRGNEFYGSYVGRTIHSKKYHYFHFDESLNDAGPVRDWGYVSWFEDVDVDNR